MARQEDQVASRTTTFPCSSGSAIAVRERKPVRACAAGGTEGDAAIRSVAARLAVVLDEEHGVGNVGPNGQASGSFPFQVPTMMASLPETSRHVTFAVPLFSVKP